MIKIKPSYMLLTGLYMAQVRDRKTNIDRSREALEACYLYESKGIIKDGWRLDGKQLFNENNEINAYALGKWMLDINMAQIQEDIRNGAAAKCEFMECEYFWYYWPRVKDIVIPPENGLFNKNPF